MTGIVWLDILITVASIFAGMFVYVLVIRTYDSVKRRMYEKARKDQKRALENAISELEEENRI